MAKKKSEHGNSVRVTRWIERLPLASGSPLVRLVFTIAILAVAWLLRIIADPVLPSGFPFVTFFPAVIITSFLFGVRMGCLSAVICGLVAWYYFIPPVNTFKLESAGVPIAFYIFVVTTELLLVLGMQTANRQLIREREVNMDLVDAKDHIVQELELQIAERKQAIDDLHESEVKTQLAIQTAGIGLWQWHVASGNILWDPTMFELYGISPTPDGSVQYSDYINSVYPDDIEQQDAILQETVSNCSASTREFRIRRRDDGAVRFIRAVETGRAGPDGKTEWVVGTNLDITEQANRDSHVQLLMGEVNHRAKNLLAVVMSVAHHTRGADHAEFMRKFSDRVQSLAAGQDLLVEKEWKGVELDTLVRAQLSHFRDIIGGRIVIGGARVHLSPSSVQTIGMAIHELTTNASKYGALSDDRGCITIAWQIGSGSASDHFVMTWIETDGPTVIPPKGSGFGSTVTEKMVRLGLNGDVQRDFAPSGFSWRFECPLQNVAERKA